MSSRDEVCCAKVGGEASNSRDSTAAGRDAMRRPEIDMVKPYLAGDSAVQCPGLAGETGAAIQNRDVATCRLKDSLQVERLDITRNA
jgi:hypothetical protein